MRNRSDYKVGATFIKTLVSEFGVSEAYADAAWLSVRNINTHPGDVAARKYAERFKL